MASGKSDEMKGRVKEAAEVSKVIGKAKDALG
jgi:hypothetical protein